MEACLKVPAWTVDILHLNHMIESDIRAGFIVAFRSDYEWRRSPADDHEHESIISSLPGATTATVHIESAILGTRRHRAPY